jgi:hypothetical protein
MITQPTVITYDADVLVNPIESCVDPPTIRCDPMKRRKKRWKMPDSVIFVFSLAILVS